MLVIALVFVFALPVAADEGIPIFLKYTPIGQGVLIDDRVYVPIRVVSESLGARVDWEDGKVRITPELRRPEIVGDSEFVRKINESLDLLEEKDFTDYSLICENVSMIHAFSGVQGEDDDSFARAIGDTVNIMSFLIDDQERYNKFYLAGVLTHEAVHANYTKYNDSSSGERIACFHEEIALRLVDAPSWMIDEILNLQREYIN